MLELVPLLALFVPLLTGQTAQQPRTAFSARVHGRIIDADTGKPVSKLRIGLVRKNYSRDGTLEAKIHASVLTDENGTYTLVATEVGRYCVATSAQAYDGSVFIPQYFPRAFEISSAAVLDLSNGMELMDVDVAVRPGQRVSVRGQLLDGLGRHLPHVDKVWLVPRDIMLQGSSQPTNPSWGSWASGVKNASRFEISGVLPGRYYLMSWRFDDIADRAQTAISIELGASDLEVDVVSYRGYNLNGRIRLQGGSSLARLQTVPGVGMSILASAADGSPVMIPTANFSQGGTFSFATLAAGTYQLSILGIAAPFFVQSAKFGNGPNLMERGISLPHGRAESLEIIIAENGGEVRGTVRQGFSAYVVLVPDGHVVLRPDLYKVVQSDKNGAYVIGGIAPGAYRLYALDSVYGNAFYDSEYMNPLIPLGTPIRIEAGTVREVELSILKQ
jgi:hypothetical protein